MELKREKCGLPLFFRVECGHFASLASSLTPFCFEECFADLVNKPVQRDVQASYVSCKMEKHETPIADKLSLNSKQERRIHPR